VNIYLNGGFEAGRTNFLRTSYAEDEDRVVESVVPEAGLVC